jgi:hypothetical protein
MLSRRQPRLAVSINKIARQIPMWQERVESILGGAYEFLLEVVTKANGTWHPRRNGVQQRLPLVDRACDRHGFD